MLGDLVIKKISDDKWAPEKVLSFFGDHGLGEVISLCLSHLAPRDGLLSEFFSVEVKFGCGITGLFGPVESSVVADLKNADIRISQNDAIGFAPLKKATRKVRGVMDCLKLDAMGKLEGRPVAQICSSGSPVYESKCYASMITADIDGPGVSEASRLITGLGFWGQKWCLPEGYVQGKEGLKRNLSRVYKLRKAAGDDARLMFEAHGSWTPAYLREFSDHAKDFNLMWLEDPLPYGLPGKYARVDKFSFPFCIGERFSRAATYEGFYGKDKNFILQADVINCGGYTTAAAVKEQCANAEKIFVLHGRRLIPSFHLAAYSTVGVAPILEYNPFFEPERQTQMEIKSRLIPNKGALNFHAVERRGLWEIQR